MIDKKGKMVSYPTLEEQGITIKDRDHALRLLAEGELKGKLMWAPFYGANYKNDIVTKIAKQWKCDASIIHLNSLAPDGDEDSGAKPGAASDDL
jgi:hypothetical protein